MNSQSSVNVESSVSEQRQGRGEYSVGQARREAILQAAMRLIGDAGYHGFSLRDLGREVGISHPAVIYHYPSKEALLRAVVKRFEDDFGLFDMELNDEVEGSVLLKGVKVDSLIDYFVQMMLFSKIPEASTIISLSTMLQVQASTPNFPVYPYFKKRMEMMREFFVEQVRILQERGEVPANVPELSLALGVVHHWFGVTFEIRYEQENFEPSDTVAQFIALSVHSLGLSSNYLLSMSNSIPDSVVDVYAKVLRKVMGKTGD